MCGNDVVEAGEACDGADLDGRDCMTEGFDDGALACTADCTGYDVSQCIIAVCGDGQVEGPELCDDGNTEADDDCTNHCVPPGTVLGSVPIPMVPDYGAALTPQGDVVIGGADAGGIRIARFTLEGETVWDQIFEVPEGTSSANVAEIAVDQPGNVYAVSSFVVHGDVSRRELRLYKLAPDGRFQWVVSLDDASRYYHATGLATTSTGGVIFSGHVSAPDQMLLGRYAADGSQEWLVAQPANDSHEQWRDVVVRPNDHAVVLSMADEEWSGAIELIEFDADGQEQWRTPGSIDGGLGTYRSQMGLLSDGSVVVGGWSSIARFDSVGAPLWWEQPIPPGGLDYLARTLIVGQEDRIYQVGRYEVFGDGGKGVGNDLLVVEYDILGQLVWSTIIDAHPVETTYPEALVETLDERLLVGSMRLGLADWQALSP